jgi:hypothetical protein
VEERAGGSLVSTAGLQRHRPHCSQVRMVGLHWYRWPEKRGLMRVSAAAEPVTRLHKSPYARGQSRSSARVQHLRLCYSMHRALDMQHWRYVQKDAARMESSWFYMAAPFCVTQLPTPSCLHALLSIYINGHIVRVALPVPRAEAIHRHTHQASCDSSKPQHPVLMHRRRPSLQSIPPPPATQCAATPSFCPASPDSCDNAHPTES